MQGDHMENLIYPFVKNIAVYSILVAVIMNILPKGQSRKQIRLFVGILLLLIVVYPITKMTGADLEMEKSLEKFQLDMQMKELTYGNASDKESEQGQYLERYEENIGKQMARIIEEEGFTGVSVTVTASADEDNFGAIQTVDIKIDKDTDQIKIDKIEVQSDNQQEKEDSLEIKQLKKTLEDFYNIDANNINIEIQG